MTENLEIIIYLKFDYEKKTNELQKEFNSAVNILKGNHRLIL